MTARGSVSCKYHCGTEYPIALTLLAYKDVDSSILHLWQRLLLVMDKQSIAKRCLVAAVYTAAVIMPGFSTHNQLYSQRYVRLTTCCYMSTVSADGAQSAVCTVSVPDSRNVTPPGDYLLTVLNDGVPSPALFIGIGP